MIWTAVGHALRDTAGDLTEQGIENAARDVRLLMAHVLGIPSSRIMLHMNDTLDLHQALDFRDMVKMRAQHMPVSHILGKRQFYGRDFKVTADVLDPRGDTETLIEVALSAPFDEVLDLGTGSGCILLTLLSERPDVTGIGSDVSNAALSVAKTNAKTVGVDARCALVESNWFDAVGGQFDLIVSNPPYISAAEMDALQPELSYEPRIALTDESDGLSAYRVIIPEASAHLMLGGRLMVEIGWQQATAVSTLFREAGFDAVTVHPDLDGRDRVVSGVWPK